VSGQKANYNEHFSIKKFKKIIFLWGSNPCQFNFFFNELKIQSINFEEEKKYLSAVGFEPTPVFTDQNAHLYKLIFQT
jgi:hypothetical protein